MISFECTNQLANTFTWLVASYIVASHYCIICYTGAPHPSQQHATNIMVMLMHAVYVATKLMSESWQNSIQWLANI